ncbi:related to nuclear pore (Nic96) [Lecanosticta acicola]|uniref:Nuclear pore protein n=1 Tax=Lecanosticta acicola TaxID=111012 RepID=A0AAI9E912_9PEZI|nr:related to nuclear pore (Nic96) [Lecanosticta acicola]
MSLSQSQAAPAYFQALLERGQKRGSSDEPQLQLGLGDIARKVRNLGKGFTDARAHYLLSASGVNTSQALRDLDELAASTAQSLPEQLPTTGVKQTLLETYQNDFQKMVDSHVQRAHEEFDQMIEERLHGVDWDAHRQRIYEHFGLKKPESQPAPDGSVVGGGAFGRSSRRGRLSTAGKSTFGIPGLSKSVIGSIGPRGPRGSAFGDIAEKLPAEGVRSAPEDSLQRRKQDNYAEKVKDLNVARLQEKVYPILTRFAEVEAEPSNDDTSMLVAAYKALVHITGEDATKEAIADPGVVRERQYAVAYLDESVRSTAEAVALRKRILKGSRTYLEKHFFTQQLEQVVARNPREAQIGGVPSAIDKVKGYVRVRAARKELTSDLDVLQQIDNDYCWAVVFYLLRSGLFQEALDYVIENRNAFKQIDGQFIRYLEAYVRDKDEHRLPSALQTSINNEYAQRQRFAPEDSVDPYRQMCYKVIGRCELARRSVLEGVYSDMQDWIWLQFALAREYLHEDELAHEAYNLQDVRQSFKDVGERYFGPGSDITNAPTTYFYMQILAGMFEKAVADLYAHNYVSAVHFAISLDFYGLLRVSDVSNSDDLLSYTTRQAPQIAFGSMIGLYTRDFRTANATAAVDYLTLICLNGDLTGDLGKAQRELCYQALTEVTLETREFAQLIGDVRDNGQRIDGAIAQRLKLIGLENQREFLKHITQVAARTAEEQGRTADAALLYHLCEDYNKVFHVINEALSLALTTELGEQPERLEPLKPRNTASQNNQSSSQQQASLSLTSIDDPVQLALGIQDLYNKNPMYNAYIDENVRGTCTVLLTLAEARKSLEDGQWPLALEKIKASNVIPMGENGTLSAIRMKAVEFQGFPPSVARTVGHVMLWTVIACSNEVDHIRRQSLQNPNATQYVAACTQQAKDVMVFAGLIRYKLPGRVWETLAQAGQDLGAY